jgi:hypothetical protein
MFGPAAKRVLPTPKMSSTIVGQPLVIAAIQLTANSRLYQLAKIGIAHRLFEFVGEVKDIFHALPQR